MGRNSILFYYMLQNGADEAQLARLKSALPEAQTELLYIPPCSPTAYCDIFRIKQKGAYRQAA